MNVFPSCIRHLVLTTAYKRSLPCIGIPSHVICTERTLSGAKLVQVAPKIAQPYLRLMRIDKPTGFWLLYWPCTWSIGLAAPPGSLPDFKMLALFACGSILMRSAGCVINDIFDKNYDKMVRRTQSRPLASGELSNREAFALLAVLLSGSLSILLQFNWFSVIVGASSLSLVIAYPLAKRFTYWPQLVLGLTSNWGVLLAWCHLCPKTLLAVIPLYTATVLYTATYDTIYSQQVLCLILSYVYSKINSRLAFNWGALLGWAAVRDELCWIVALLLYLASLNWTLIYDTIYAHQDKKDDIMAGVKSTALLFGDKTKKWLTGFAVATVLGFGTTGAMLHQTWPFYTALSATAAHLSWQIWTVNINDPNDCWKKFKTNQWLGVILFSGIVLGNVLRQEDTNSTNNL
ncbi:unnamed protein product [Thelazia callipaeda]|uniref:4-hydroxybenzoate polyprenyltransferase, mitochondrial n=1 Tax=Thelazia callipaeda TaxID=103827 RepID=A0A0N5D6S4_THECL|nr:unnamed protein product [Thelazia callipaeda]